MGKAHQAPMDHYTRTRYVSFHAVERLRERIGDKHSLSFRDDVDLGNALDVAVKNSLTQPNLWFSRERDGRVEKVVDVSTHFGFPLRAIATKNSMSNSMLLEAIVTIMEGPLRETAGGALIEEPRGSKLGSIGDGVAAEDLKRLRDAVSPGQKLRAEAQASMSPAKPEQAATGFSTWSAKPEARLILITRPGLPDEVLTPQNAEVVTRELLRLQSEGADMKGVSVWRPVKVSIAVTSEEG